MLGQLAKLFKIARRKNNSNGQEPLQMNHSASKNTIEWQPLDVSKLNITTNRVRQIEARMVKDARDEFAAVMKEFNSSQSARKANNN